MKPATAPSALRVQAALGPDYQVLEFDAGTRTAAEAAAAIGCTAAEIAKSLIFRAEPSERAVLVIASGAKRVDERKVGEIVGERIVRADADFVRDKTGFAIGGVPPIGHAEPLLTLIDESLSAFETIWAAAGTPNAVFRLTPADVLRVTGGAKAAIAR
jgi:prolyl-tRNA editing enzyme YbaK/EbsC (Cys-tRNA(Pro) deacylase)